MLRSKIIIADISIKVLNAFKYVNDAIKAVIRSIRSAVSNMKLSGRKWFYWLTGNQQAQQALIQEETALKQQQELERAGAETKDQYDQCNADILRIQLIFTQYFADNPNSLLNFERPNLLAPGRVVTDQASLESGRKFVANSNTLINGLKLYEELTLSIRSKRLQARSDINNITNLIESASLRVLFAAFEAGVMMQQTQLGQQVTAGISNAAVQGYNAAVQAYNELQNLNQYVNSARESFLRNASDNQSKLAYTIATPISAIIIQAASRVLPLVSFMAPIDIASKYYNGLQDLLLNSNQSTDSATFNRICNALTFIIGFLMLVTAIKDMNKHIVAPVVWDRMLSPAATPLILSGGPRNSGTIINAENTPAEQEQQHELRDDSISQNNSPRVALN